MNTINVIEQPLPGIGKRFEFQLDAEHDLTVVALKDGGRHVTILDRTNAEPITTTLRLDADQAVTLGALLFGARFTLDAPETSHRGTVVVDTVTLSTDAPGIGQTPTAALAEFGTDAVALAVIREQSPDIVEDDLEIPLSEGDRVAIAVRRPRHRDAVQTLAGVAPAHD